MCIKLSITQYFPEFCGKKIHWQITRVGFGPVIFPLLEQMPYHSTTKLARWLEAGSGLQRWDFAINLPTKLVGENSDWSSGVLTGVWPADYC